MLKGEQDMRMDTGAMKFMNLCPDICTAAENAKWENNYMSAVKAGKMDAAKSCDTCNRLLTRNIGGLGCESFIAYARRFGDDTETAMALKRGISKAQGMFPPMLPKYCGDVYATTTCNPLNAVDICMKRNGLTEIRFPTMKQAMMNETNETEFDVYMLATPPPTAVTSQITVSAVITSAAASAPDVTALKEAMLAGLLEGGQDVTAADIEAVVSYAVKQGFTFPAGVTVVLETATEAIALSFGVAASQVKLVITSGRRLRNGRSLQGAATQVEATIQVNDPTAADALKVLADDTAAIATTLKAKYQEAH
jgi:hypothetical protein